MARKFAVPVLVLLFVTLMAPLAVESRNQAVKARNQDGLLSGILGGGLMNIKGILYCTINGAIGANGTATPVFSNALVQLTCGAGNVVTSATTNSNGAFSMLLSPLQYVLSLVLNECKLVVPTPLSTCDSSLPAIGGLVSLLQNIGNIVIGIVSVLLMTPVGFNLIPAS